MIIAHIGGLPVEESLVSLASSLGTCSLLLYEFKRRRPRLRSRRLTQQKEFHRDHRP